MKRTTKKLSGPGLELFLRRFFTSYPGIDDGLARRMSADGARTFSSIRVRRLAWTDWRRKPDVQSPPAPSKSFSTPVPRPPATQLEVSSPAATDTFDPYAIGLIPTFQREGADGLLTKLASISSIDNLRKMARSQQISLPAELRGADAQIDAVRSAIVAAVEKRIADRRAAAG